MSKKHSTAAAANGKRAKPVKPEKPYPEFSLTAHPADNWCKKIKSKIHHFGPCRRYTPADNTASARATIAASGRASSRRRKPR